MAKKPKTRKTGRKNARKPLYNTLHPQGGTLPAELLAGGTPQELVGNVHQAAFLTAFKVTGNLCAAAKAAGVTRQAHYWWLNNDAAYAQALEDAKVEALDAVELECRRRGVDGVDEYVLYKGQVVMHEGAPLIRKRYSDTLMVTLLRALAPEKYGPRQRTGTTPQRLPEGGAHLAEARLDKIEEHLRLEEERRLRDDDVGAPPDGSA